MPEEKSFMDKFGKPIAFVVAVAIAAVGGASIADSIKKACTDEFKDQPAAISTVNP